MMLGPRASDRAAHPYLSAVKPWHRLILALGVLGVLTLVSCGSSTPTARPSPEGPTPTVTVPVELPVTIALAGRFSGAALAALDELIAAFESANPGVMIEVVRAPRNEEDRREWIGGRLSSGDTSIDLFLLNPTWHGDLAATAGLVPLESLLPPLGVRVDSFLPATISANTVDGKLVAVPWSADGGLLYYRLDLLDKHGYRPPTTWHELQDMAIEIKAEEGLPHGYVWPGAPQEDLTCSTLEVVWDQGGDVLDPAGAVIFDSTESQAGLQQMAAWLTSGASPADTAAYDGLTALEAFRNGQAVFLRDKYLAWDYLAGGDSPIAGQVGIAPLPVSCLGGQSLGLSAHSLHQEQALKFLAFLVGHEQQVAMALSANQPPALAAAYRDPDLLASSPTWAVLRTIWLGARARPSIRDYPRFSETIYSEVNRLLAGEQNVAATAANIQHRLELILQ